jgi:hypothetical protein
MRVFTKIRLLLLSVRPMIHLSLQLPLETEAEGRHLTRPVELRHSRKTHRDASERPNGAQ